MNTKRPFELGAVAVGVEGIVDRAVGAEAVDVVDDLVEPARGVIAVIDRVGGGVGEHVDPPVEQVGPVGSFNKVLN